MEKFTDRLLELMPPKATLTGVFILAVIGAWNALKSLLELPEIPFQDNLIKLAEAWIAAGVTRKAVRAQKNIK